MYKLKIYLFLLLTIVTSLACAQNTTSGKNKNTGDGRQPERWLRHRYPKRLGKPAGKRDNEKARDTDH